MGTPKLIIDKRTKMNNKFLPTNIDEAKKLGHSRLDVILITADAYVDHPSFGAAIIGRFLESIGLAVGIISQPDWKSLNDFTVLGKPRLFFGITAGNMDSMVNLYTSQRKIRSEDAYSENGKIGKRPYLPTIVYSNKVRQIYKDTPIIIGGIEASLRRIAHYDAYQNKIRKSILADSKADILVYGNGEAPLREIVTKLRKGIPIDKIKNIRGTAVPLRKKGEEFTINAITLPSFDEVRESKDAFSEMTKIIYENLNPFNAKPLIQQNGSFSVLINEPQFPLTTKELDAIYALPFARKQHPQYNGRIPALKVVENSITAHRGCYGGCYFCSINIHQGKFIQSRSADSIKKEIDCIIKQKQKNIVITDIGGPTANMYATYCSNEKAKTKCKRLSCIFPNICPNLNFENTKYLSLLEKVRNTDGVKNVYINSGIRYDIIKKDDTFVKELVAHYTQGQISVAPEHSHSKILQNIGKPPIESFINFCDTYYNEAKRQNKKYFVTPYFITGLPGANDTTEADLSHFIKKHKMKARQVQEFLPTPMTIATSMYVTGKNPFTSESVEIQKKLGKKKLWKKMIITGRKQ